MKYSHNHFSTRLATSSVVFAFPLTIFFFFDDEDEDDDDDDDDDDFFLWFVNATILVEIPKEDNNAQHSVLPTHFVVPTTGLSSARPTGSKPSLHANSNHIFIFSSEGT